MPGWLQAISKVKPAAPRGRRAAFLYVGNQAQIMPELPVVVTPLDSLVPQNRADVCYYIIHFRAQHLKICLEHSGAVPR
jgi:hypothetical protein